MDISDRLKTSPMDRPPPTAVGVLGWLRQNLFSSWSNTSLTIITFVIIFFVGRSVISWSIHEANWRVIPSNLGVLIWGRYPREEVWRLALSLGIIVVLGLLTWWTRRSEAGAKARRVILIGWLISPIALTILIRGITLPTLASITNNLGYYIFRPEVLPLLGESWRANASLVIVAVLAGMTWGIHKQRKWRIAAGVVLLGLLGLFLPLGLQMEGALFGIRLPLLVSMLVVLIVGFLAGRTLGLSLANVEGVQRGLTLGWCLAIPILIIIMTSFDVGVERVAPSEVLLIIQPNIWSGILLTMILSTVSIVASFPIGVLLALGRRSSLPVVKTSCVLFIELVRGVPLITILFMAQVMLPLFLPLEMTVDRVVRAMAGMTLFTGAYLAEVVRGGLQSVRKEQIEAARALGLSEILVTGLIVLPQALRAVIPPIMGQFVSIFKDTSLVTIVGLLDLLAVCQSVIKQREFLGAVREVYMFAGVFYFVVSYAMSLASRRLEKQLGVSETI